MNGVVDIRFWPTLHMTLVLMQVRTPTGFIRHAQCLLMCYDVLVSIARKDRTGKYGASPCRQNGQ
jgi:hypothetical protein